MNINRREFLMGGCSLAAGVVLAKPVRSVVGSSNLGYTEDGPVPTALDYIRDGILFQWDMKENAGYGEYNPNQQYVLELINGYKANFSTAQAVWTGDSLEGIATINHIVPGEVAQNIELIPTIEVVGYPLIETSQWSVPFYSLTSGYAYRQIMAVKNVPARWRYYGACIEGLNFVYSDLAGGTFFTGSGMVSAWGNNIRLFFSYGAGETSSCGVCAIRCYSRVLSDSELSYNQTIDRIRFGL